MNKNKNASAEFGDDITSAWSGGLYGDVSFADGASGGLIYGADLLSPKQLQLMELAWMEMCNGRQLSQLDYLNGFETNCDGCVLKNVKLQAHQGSSK